MLSSIFTASPDSWFAAQKLRVDLDEPRGMGECIFADGEEECVAPREQAKPP